jgi:hypothetical protein
MIDGVLIVTGQPRSGTSLMMRVLRDSGFPVFADEPGSFETKKAISLGEDNEWMAHLSPGTAVKVLFPHLLHIPIGTPYHFLWMHRNPHEQAKSQRRYSGQTPKWERERRKFIRKLEKSFPPMFADMGPLLRVSFDRFVKEPEVVAGEVSYFLRVPMLDFGAVTIRDPKCSTLPVGTLEVQPHGH